MRVVINPGTEDIEGCSIEKAKIILGEFLKELQLRMEGETLLIEKEDNDHRGWYYWKIKYKEREISLGVPGVEREKVIVDCVRLNDGSCAVRLYVNYGSWWWKFALDVMEELLTGEEEEE